VCAFFAKRSPSVVQAFRIEADNLKRHLPQSKPQQKQRPQDPAATANPAFRISTWFRFEDLPPGGKPYRNLGSFLC